MSGEERGQPLLLPAVEFVQGHFFDQVFRSVIGVIGFFAKETQLEHFACPFDNEVRMLPAKLSLLRIAA